MSFDIFANFATDETLEVVGVWHSVAKGAEIRVARADNPVYMNALSEFMDAELEKVNLPENPSKEQKEKVEKSTRSVLVRAAARGLLLDWKGLSYKGKPIDYSVENAEKLLSHKDFLEYVLKVANDVRNYRLKIQDEQEKNS